MTALSESLLPRSSDVTASSSSTFHDVRTIAGRALRAVPKDPAAIVPALFLSFFFFIVNIATLKPITEGALDGFDYAGFQMATAVLLGVTGLSRAPSMVIDVQNGYLDRLLLTPVSRTAILFGHLIADIVIAAILVVPIIALGFAFGVRFEAGILGILVFMVVGSLWSLVFAGFGYALALKTGNPAAVQSSFLLFFPFLFMTSSYVPRSQLSGWLDTIATYNPVTYILEGLRSLVFVGWEWTDLAGAFIAIFLVGAISITMCFSALRARAGGD